MNKETKLFIEDLKENENILGVILFGSWARGNNRPTSDVDLLVIQKEGYKRTVEKRGSQDFEIIYTTAQSAFDYWNTDKNGCYGLWKVARVLFDKDGSIEKLRERAEKEIIIPGKSKINNHQFDQYHFDAKDQLEYVRQILDIDIASANMVLSNKVFNLTELFFDLRQIWTPAPKQRLSEVKKIDTNTYKLFNGFYIEGKTIQEKINIVEKIIQSIFENNYLQK